MVKCKHNWADVGVHHQMNFGNFIAKNKEYIGWCTLCGGLRIDDGTGSFRKA